MRRIHKFLGLPPADRSLLVKSAFLVGAIRVGLWVVPFKTLCRLLAGVVRLAAGPRELPQASTDRVGWAVATSSRYVPSATCLVQALATKVLLGLFGHAARLRIGIARGAGGQLEAHAWVESEGEVVIGGLKDLARYTRLRMPPAAEDGLLTLCAATPTTPVLSGEGAEGHVS